VAQNAESTSPNRKNIPQPEAERLWAASAGRCNLCNTSLLRDETTGVVIKTGEKAHVVGVSDGPRSPRGQEDLPLKERNKAENLILLCEKHHTEVDKKVEEYPRERLLEIKRDFEERIFFLTSLGPERETLVLRVLGDIHGSKVPDITREQAREIVLEGEGRYPRYALSASEHDMSVDLRDLTNEGDEAYWLEARARIQQRLEHVDQLRSEGRAAHISVLALARIPVLVVLGDALGDATDATIYHRQNDGGWGWDLEAGLVAFEVIDHGGSSEDTEVTLMCSTTAQVQFDRAPKELVDAPRYEIRPVNMEPGVTVLDHPDALPAFKAAYRQFLSHVEEAHPEAAAIHLLPAVQADVAVALGQVRTPSANPPLVVYDRDKESGLYLRTCEVGS